MTRGTHTITFPTLAAKKTNTIKEEIVTATRFIWARIICFRASLP